MTDVIDHSQLLGRLGGWRMQADRVATECRGPEEVTLAEWACLRGDLDAAIAALETPAPACICYRCLTESGETQGGFPVTALRMVVCGACGNKRCPHATDHRFACTGSNDLNQTGSRYADDWSAPDDWRRPGNLQKMQIAPDRSLILAGELDRLSAIWMVMSEQQTPGVCADIALFAMQNRAAIISALRVAGPPPPEDRLDLNPDGSLNEVVITGTAHLEQLTTRSYFLNMTREDGSSLAVWFTAARGKLNAPFEERDPSPTVEGAAK